MGSKRLISYKRLVNRKSIKALRGHPLATFLLALFITLLFFFSVQVLGLKANVAATQSGSYSRLNAYPVAGSNYDPVPEDHASPVVIGVAGDSSSKSAQSNSLLHQTSNDEPVGANYSRLLLWVAFLVAVSIFTAAIIGAVVVYTRRRPVK